MRKKTLAKLTSTEKKRLMRLAREQRHRKTGNRISTIFPDDGKYRRELYKKHVAFLNGGSKFRVRLFMAANRIGKTETGAYETTLHLTGLYPAWWTGRKFIKRTRWWVAGKSNKTTMDIIQAKLLGTVETINGKKVVSGTGMIPRHLIDMKSLTWKSGAELKDAVNSVRVRHVSGGWSMIQFKSYEQGRGAFEGTEREGIWLDEEPPMEVYTEALTRTMTTRGVVLITFTPLEGTTDVVDLIVKRSGEGKTLLVNATWDDVPHLTEKDKQTLLDNFPKHEWDARSKGIPYAGSGLIFPIDEKEITVEPFEIPVHWPLITGLDFGWDHPTAATLLAWDRDNDIIYVVDEYRQEERTPAQHAPHIQSLCLWAPVAWPHDGLQHDNGSGEKLKDLYITAGLKMLPERATHDDGTNGVEAGLMEMLTRMQQGRWKVFSDCQHWLEERRMYHRDKGKVVKLKDDVISSSRYAMMMLRFAATKPIKPTKTRFRNKTV
jgi:phage terminase large subunit-like protein